MSLWQIARRNIRHQGRRYAAFFFSSTFAVWMFFLYGSLLFHPVLQVPGNEELSRILLFVEGVVALFALLFVRFAHTAFLKGRARELATWKLLGMPPGKLLGLITLELMSMGAGATLAGIGLGLVFLRFFLLGMSRIMLLDRPIPFYLSGPALGLTAATFLLLFSAIALLSRRMLERIPVADLFRASAQPREAPRYSRWGVLAGALCLAAAYGFIATFDRESDDDLLLWMLTFLIAGTYLLFTHGSLAIIQWLKRRPALYLRGTNLLIISQFVYKLRDNARILFMITILSTFSLTATGLWYGSYVSVERQAEIKRPVALEFAGSPGGLTPERVEEALGGAISARGSIDTLSGFDLRPQGGQPLLIFRVMSLGGVNDWLRQNGEAAIALNPDGAAILLDESQPVFGPLKGREGLPAQLRSKVGQPVWAAELRLERVLSTELFNLSGLLVLPDSLFQQAAQGRRVESLHLYQLKEWQRFRAAAVALEREVRDGMPPDQPWGYPEPLSGTGIFYYHNLQAIGFLMMIGIFLGLLFLLASGNMLYFKLFTDLLEEREQFRGLARVGIRPVEVRRVVSVQTLTLFLLPLALAIFNASMIASLFRRLLPSLQWSPILMVAGLYTALFLVYWAITRRTYVTALMAPDKA